jgi:hypothetical protein
MTASEKQIPDFSSDRHASSLSAQVRPPQLRTLQASGKPLLGWMNVCPDGWSCRSAKAEENRVTERPVDRAESNLSANRGFVFNQNYCLASR